mmetsp:Transcript_5257/g.12081  ORF Transcript_5257/g.12081 Transcript_5257/m.12081 type:complete len:281 (+) Transcript_5257:110-952(+)
MYGYGMYAPAGPIGQKGKGKGKGKGKPTASYQYAVLLRPSGEEEAQRQAELRRSRERKTTSRDVKDMLDLAEGPLLTSHPKACDLVGNRVVAPESEKELEDYVAEVFADVDEDDMLPGDRLPSRSYDPRTWDYSWSQERPRQQDSRPPQQDWSYPPESQFSQPRSQTAARQSQPHSQQGQPQPHQGQTWERSQPQQDQPQRQQGQPRQERPLSGQPNQIWYMAHSFDGRQYGADYLVLTKGERIVWLKEEDNWILARRVDERPGELNTGWLPPLFAQPAV